MNIQSSLMKNRQSNTSLLAESRPYIKYKSLSTVTEDERKLTSRNSNQDNFELKKVRTRMKPGEEDTENRNGDKSNNSNTVLITKDVSPSDSLRSFSLLYGCTINELKRVNGLISDQDFYALNKIKIPVNRYSFLTVAADKKLHPPASTKLGSLEEPRVDNKLVDLSDPKPAFCESIPQLTSMESVGTPNSSDSLESLEDTSLLISSTKGKAIEQNNTSGYLKKIDKDIIKVVKNADLKGEKSRGNESLDEVVSSISSIQYYPIDSPIMQGKLRGSPSRTNGADCGMKWWTLILCFFLVLIVIGILAVIEYYRTN